MHELTDANAFRFLKLRSFPFIANTDEINVNLH